ncbi:MAG: hypothetical protein ABSH08_15150 [Tepidisphaeraceae bacterium]|jgi:hypothetical protein
MDLLVRIKRAVIAGHVVFTRTAVEERQGDGLTEQDVRESIINATAIYKSIRSISRKTKQHREMLHVIYGTTLTGTVVYTKGKLLVESGIETYYVLISAKRSE